MAIYAISDLHLSFNTNKPMNIFGWDDYENKIKEIAMQRTRKEVENLEELVKSKKKKYVRYAEGAELFSMGLHSFQSLAKDAGAIRKVKGCVLVNLEKVEAFVESFAEEDY